VNVVFDDFKYVPFTQEVDCDVADKGRMVPHHSQVDPRWSAVKYDHTDGSLGSLGCALSSLSMILSSYGLRTDNLGAPLTPMTLNTGLSNLSSPINGELLGFTKTGGILWQGAVLYGRQAFTNQCLRDGGEAPTCIQEGINSLAFKGIKRGSDYSYEMVRREICNGNPVMLEVPSRSAPQDLSKSHFVVASAAVTIDGVRTFKIKDPATLAQPNRDVLLSTEYGNTVRGVRLFSPTRDPSMIFIYATPNVEFVVTDPLGQKTGRNSITDESYSNIPGAVYTVEPGIADLERVGGVDRSTQPQLVFQNIEAPVEGQYDIKVYGKGGGAYELAIYGFDSDGYQNNFTRSTGVLGQGEVKTISFGQSELPYVPPVSQINADLKNVRIKTIEVTLPKKKKMEKLSITGQISQKNKKTFSVLFKKKIKLHIGEFKLELSRNDFRWIGIGSLGIYTHTDFNRNLSVILTSTGTVSVTSTQGSSFNAGSFDVLRIELDDLIAEKSITVKCKNKICTGK
jgi:hypothetical protein